MRREWVGIPATVGLRLRSAEFCAPGLPCIMMLYFLRGSAAPAPTATEYL